MATKKTTKSKTAKPKANAVKKTAGKKSPAPKKAAKAVKTKAKAAGKKPAVKKVKVAAKKASRPVKKATAKKAAPKKAVKKAVAKKVTKKTATKKAAPKKAVKKTVAKKVAAKSPKLKSAPVKAGKAPKNGVKARSSKPAPSAKPVKAAPKAVKSPKAKPVVKPVAPKAKATRVKGSKATDSTHKPAGVQVPATGNLKASAGKAKTAQPTRKAKSEPSVKPSYKMIQKKEQQHPEPVVSTLEPQKTRYSDSELKEFDQLIDQKLIIAREQLEFYLKQLEEIAENPDNKIKGLDDGMVTLETERLTSLAGRQQKLIQHLENAKIRIKNKVYGICRETGKLISKERLRAVPHATLSIEAKQAQQ